MGIVATEQNQFTRSRELLTEALQSFTTLQDRLGMCECLEAFGCLEAKEQKWQRSAISKYLCYLYHFTLVSSVPPSFSFFVIDHR